MKLLPMLLLSVGSVLKSESFLAPTSTIITRKVSHACESTLRLTHQNHDDGPIKATAKSDVHQRRRDFLQSLGSATLISASSVLSFPSTSTADDDYLYKRGEGGGDLTSQLFNEDGSLRDPNMVVEAQERSVDLMFSLPTHSNGVDIAIATDGAQPSSSTTDAAVTNLKTSYKLPLKWNQGMSSNLPLYYDSSEGKNGKSCNRITVYTVSSPSNLDMTTLEKASRVGVAKSLFMDQLPNKYFDQGVSKADLISGRTVRKPIKSLEEGEIDEQVYYEFDLAFAPSECPDYTEGNRENLGLGFCPYDNIFLVSATVLKENSGKDKSGTLMCCVVECNKDEWKMANSDLKRVRSSFMLDRA